MGKANTNPQGEEYLIKVFNAEVRALVKENRHHDRFEDYWAEGRSYIVQAANKGQALKKLENMCPPADGFVCQPQET